MIIRPEYLKKLLTYKNAPLVKILAGIRRSGKSTILEMLKESLMNDGVDSEHIVHKTYSSFEIMDNFSARNMYEEIRKCIKDDNTYYLLLDEVQEVDGWEKCINSLLEGMNVDIYVTGSNSKLMAGEISTYLTGRYVLIHVYPLSFKEYLKFKTNSPLSNRELLNEYIRYGGFPIIAMGNYDEQSAYQIVEGIYSSVVTSDITKRHNITNTDLFNRVVLFIVENVGKTFSANSIAKFLKGENRSLSVETIYNYLEWLEKAFVIYRCQRYDIQGKSVLKTQEKFYLADQSIKYSIIGFNPKSISSMLENIVYFELKRKGFDVYIGKSGTKEIDFIACKREEKVYIQVCWSIPENSDREISNLLSIKDQYPKFIVTLDELDIGNVQGVRIVHLLQFLTEELF